MRCAAFSIIVDILSLEMHYHHILYKCAMCVQLTHCSRGNDQSTDLIEMEIIKQN